MTEAQADEIITLLVNVLYWVKVVAIASSWLAAQMTWRLIILAKNQMRLW